MRLKRRLTYANVMSSIAVFLVLGGATALAASQLGKNSVGGAQLKRNAVTAAKIKKNAVTSTKIKKDAITGSKIKDGSIGGADINAGSTSFSQVVTRLRDATTVPFESGKTYSNLSYTQNAGEDNQVVSGLDVNFAASCVAPRVAQAYLLEDAGSPVVPTILNVVGVGLVEDKGSGAATRRIDFGPLPGAYATASKIAPAVATGHTFTVFLASASCSSGSGITASGTAIDVIGTK